MKTTKNFKVIINFIGLLAAVWILMLSGCATQKYVGEQVSPVADRIGQTESKLEETEAQIATLGDRATASEGKITKIEEDLSKVDAKAEQALASFGNLKFERRLVIDMKDSVTFDFNSAILQEEAKQAIDVFIDNLNGDNNVFLVAGHTDSTGSEDINYELGKRRADAVSRYLVTQKKIEPLRVVTVSYGETSPIAGNDTREDRAKNRRVEIFVYSEGISK